MASTLKLNIKLQQSGRKFGTILQFRPFLSLNYLRQAEGLGRMLCFHRREKSIMDGFFGGVGLWQQ